MEAFIQLSVVNQLNREVVDTGLSGIGYFVSKVNFVEPKFLADQCHVYYGNVNWVKNIVTDHGYRCKQYGHVPDCLTAFAGRDIIKMTLREVLARDKQPIFIKPTENDQKLFNGFIFSNAYYQLVDLAHVDEGTELYTSAVIPIVSEWRCLIHNNKLAGITHYKGLVTRFPCLGQLHKMLEVSKKDLPISYALDIGVTKKNETIVIEVNDSITSGWYGINPSIVGRALSDRWEQIHKEKQT